MTHNPDEQSSAPINPEDQPAQPAPSFKNKPNKPMSDSEQSLLHKVAEVGEDTVKRLKEIFSEVDREELRRSVNREHIQRTIATTLDALNTKAQSFLAPKGEPEMATEEYGAEKGQSLSTSPDSPGPVGSEAVHPDDAPKHSKDEPPESETRNFA